MAAARASLCAILLLVASTSASASEVVDRVVAVVDQRIVLQSEVQFEQALAPLDRGASPFWDAERATAVERLMQAAMLRERAGTVSLYQPSEAAIDERLAQLRSSFLDKAAWDAFLERWGYDEGALRDLLHRRMVVERYLRRNVLGAEEDDDAWMARAEDLIEEHRRTHRFREVAPLPRSP